MWESRPLLGETVFVTVGDITTIPRSLPRPALPDLLMIPALVMPALAISIIGLVQGAGVSQSYPNPDGKFPDVSRDFTGQGIANIATSFFSGIPGGGSMSGTAVTVNAGARSRWANILAGLFVILIVLLFAGVVKLIPMSALAGLLIVVGFQNLQPQQILMVWQTGRVAQTAMILTLAATLALPLQYAIVIGVAISIMMHVFRSSNQLRLVEFVPVEGGFPIEQPAPIKLADHEVTLLYAYGSLFFAAAATFEKNLPNADDAKAGSCHPHSARAARGGQHLYRCAAPLCHHFAGKRRSPHADRRQSTPAVSVGENGHPGVHW